MSELRALYLLGPPGAGKSTLMRALVAPLPVLARRERPIAHVWYPGAVQLGRDGGHGDFPGTDALALDAIRRALPWLARVQPPLLLAEGDRLANARFFAALVALGYRLALVHLVADEATLAARRRARGSAQQPAWCAGRATKHARLAAAHGARALDATRPVAALVDEVRALLDAPAPALAGG